MLWIEIKEKTAYFMDRHYLENISQCYIPELPEVISEHPTIFLVNKDHIISHLFVPDLYPEFQETYFTNVLSEFFE